MHVGGSLEGRTWCSSTRGRSRGTTDGGGSSCRSAGPSMRVLDVSGLDRVPLVDARSRRPSRPVVQFDRGAGLRAPGPRYADDHVDRDLQLVDVSGLDRVPLVDGDRADVSGRHAHAHTSAHAHEHDAHAHDTSAHARPPNPAYTGNGCKVKLSYIISAFSTLSTHRVTNHRPLLSGVIGGRRGILIVMGLGVSSIRPRRLGMCPRRG